MELNTKGGCVREKKTHSTIYPFSPLHVVNMESSCFLLGLRLLFVIFLLPVSYSPPHSLLPRGPQLWSTCLTPGRGTGCTVDSGRPTGPWFSVHGRRVRSCLGPVYSLVSVHSLTSWDLGSLTFLPKDSLSTFSVWPPCFVNYNFLQGSLVLSYFQLSKRVQRICHLFG